MWKLYQENTYVSECRGKRSNQATQNCLGKLGDLRLIYFFLTFYFFHLKSPYVISRAIHLLNFSHGASGHWIRLHEEKLAKSETVTVAT